MKDHKPSAWVKLNAYGFVLAGLATLAALDLIHPAHSDLAKLVGDIPPGQSWWTVGIIASGVLLFVGFFLVDRVTETAGLCLLTLSVAAQTAVALWLLGWTDFTGTRLIILGIIGTCTWARSSVLWSREGLAISIPPRTERIARRRR